jgi:WD40 repeat protein
VASTYRHSRAIAIRSGWSPSLNDSTGLASASLDYTVKIWDIGSGECLQMLSIGKGLSNVSFNRTSLYLRSEIGTFAIVVSSVSNMILDVSSPQNPRYQGWGLSSEGAWITYNSENQVRLPIEYRPFCSAILGTTIGIVVRFGNVWICNFKAVKA